MRVLLTGLLLLAGCKKTEELPKAPQSDAAVPSPSAAAPAPSARSARATCGAEPKGGVAIPASAKATDIRIASTETKAFVTWWEVPMGPSMRPEESAFGHLFEAGAVSPRIRIDANVEGDEPISGAAPVAVGGDLVALACNYHASEGVYTCGKRSAGGKRESLFAFNQIGSGGPDIPGIAGIVTATDTAIFVPGNASDVLVFTASASGKRKVRAFSFHDSDKLPHADGLVAVASGADEAAVVYRATNAIQTRRTGFDETWRGNPTTLSTPKSQVGAPAAASDGTHVVALFSERPKASDPWHIAMTDLSTTTALPMADQAQGPGIAARGACFVVSWVEGTGKTTRTRLGQMCNGAIDPASITTLSAEGVEGGRAYPTKDFVVWQELPPGKPAELRIAKLACL